MSSAKGLHTQSIEILEKEQDFLSALKLADEAVVAYADEDNAQGIAEVFGSRQNIFYHLHGKTGNTSYLILAKHAAMASVEIAEENNVPATMPYRDLAKAHEKLGDYQKAVSYYNKALDSSFPQEHNRASVKTDIKAHLAYVKYKSGDRFGLDLMNQAISELENAEENDKYKKDTWLSGAHMRTAEMLREDNPGLAKEHLQKAKDIIDANKELVLRKNQWEKLSNLFT